VACSRVKGKCWLGMVAGIGKEWVTLWVQKGSTKLIVKSSKVVKGLF